LLAGGKNKFDELRMIPAVSTIDLDLNRCAQEPVRIPPRDGRIDLFGPGAEPITQPFASHDLAARGSGVLDGEDLPRHAT
jgi:hypothetical protein